MKKDIVLEKLKSKDDFISGEALSEELNITRTAIWKIIRNLREDGYVIEARTNLGYRLVRAPDLVTKEEISKRLLGRPEELLHCFDTIDSTNTYLKSAVSHSYPDGTIVVANHQTLGRGRRNRRYQCSPNKGIYLSVLWRPTLSPSEILPLTALGAVAICNAIEKVTGLRPGIKWSNDLVIHGKKLCGILTEMAVEGETGQIDNVIMGIGINVHQTEEDFEEEVKQIATSLFEETGRYFSRADIIAAMIEELDKLRAVLGGDISSYLEAYRRDCITLGKEVRLLWRDTAERVFALDVDEQFGLVVRHETGLQEVIRTGEVSVRGLYGYTP